jgi:hypothetical protein
MSNMSYCQFENTSLDMRQLLNTMAEAIDKGKSLKLSETEDRAYQALLTQCEDFVRMNEDLEDGSDNGEDFDEEE